MAARGVQFLRSKAKNLQVGESALAAIALLKADVPASDGDVANWIAKVRARFSSQGYRPERSTDADAYEVSCAAIALASLGGDEHRQELQMLVQWLSGRQNANGSWDYPNRTNGDTSISQYVVLGLWEAETSGAQVAPAVWDRAAAWYLSVQASGGSWNYHRDESFRPETVSMTAAGVGSLLICQRQLARYRGKSMEGGSSLLQTLAEDPKVGRFEPSTSNASIDKAVRAGINWLGSNFMLSLTDQKVGLSVFYGLYTLERMGALAGKNALGKVDWYEAGRQFLASTQKSDGSWGCSFQTNEINTSWAVLFLARATSKTLRKIEIKRLGAGTLLGGRDLPKDLSNLTIAGGRVVSRPMNGAVEKMLAVLEDPRAADTADSALAGLVDRYQREGPKALKPFKDRFRKMMGERDPGLRRVAAWSLARTGDLDVVPALIDALADGDDAVVTTAREGLQLLSRKIDGYGPSPGAALEQRKEAAQRWRAWYQAIRPLDLEGQDDDLVVPGSAPPRSTQ
jgi:hypothetical protein